MITQQLLHETIASALREDAPWGDITAVTVIPSSAHACAHLIAREDGVLSGGEVFRAVFIQTNASIDVTLPVKDGDSFARGQVLATVQGPARGILTAERIALNFVQRMSGIATLTAEYVSRIAGTRARLVDTRKTTPGLRIFEKYAVTCGGGYNHRFGLSDAIMVKDNHLAILQQTLDTGLTEALLHIRKSLGHTVHIEVEVDRLDQIETVLAAGVDTIMLDNFSLEDLRTGVALIAGRALVEASGGINLDTIADIAATGVDMVSVGALTHSVRSLDLGLDVTIALTDDSK
ncbi:MAG: carboxylating nicotinate-nucleotide diphosphorylase [Xanthomonadaceae bacterium]|jgi:nicotinate-nucleotide pyrophosphorylase (carboxylating)|nr:carboxylating nicotinate-nucleotide diphosphorylase [Xanthomonadaceae bacterium]